MEDALRHHISISFEKDPAEYKSLSVRLEAILISHHDDWDALTRQLQKLIDEATAAAPDPSADYGLKPGSEAPISGTGSRS
jgi:type I restriction enzyme, R subunit